MLIAVMTLSAVKWSYFCTEYCTDVSTVTDFSTVLLYGITNIEM